MYMGYYMNPHLISTPFFPFFPLLILGMNERKEGEEESLERIISSV